MKVSECLEQSASFLLERGVDENRANAEWILAHVLKTGRAALNLESSRRLKDSEKSAVNNLVTRRSQGEPLAYVLGFQPFLDLNISVDRRALIPRSETEELVLAASSLFKGRETANLQVLEFGAGTGAIALALAKRFPNAAVVAADISSEALDLARENAQGNGLGGRVRFVRDDLFNSQISGRFDLLISNPPYIASGMIDSLSCEVRAEPHLALDGGPDGLSALRAIIARAPSLLKPGGWIALEFGDGQGSAVASLLRGAGLTDVILKNDAQGLERIAMAQGAGVRASQFTKLSGATGNNFVNYEALTP